MNMEDWRNVPCSAKPYKGQEPYIFISYAHKDAALVFPVIEQLVADGYRVWYDEGIDPGSEWPEIIANRLSDCTACIAFISKHSLDSHNCRREINFALHKQKHFISVILEEVTMSAGMEMQLSVNQSIFKYKIRTEQNFYEKLYEAEFLRATQQVAAETTGTVQYEEPKPEEPPVCVPQPGTPVTPQPAPKKHKKGLWIALLIAVILVAAGGIIGFMFMDEGDDTLRMSNDLYDFTVCIEGDVVQLPCSYEDFTKLGWQPEAFSGLADTLDAKAITGSVFVKNGCEINVILGNPGNGTRAIQNCQIIGLVWESDSDTEIMLAKGIVSTSSLNQIVEAYGEPKNEISETWLIYTQAHDYSSFYTFSFDEESDEITEICVLHTNGVSYDDLNIYE